MPTEAPDSQTRPPSTAIEQMRLIVAHADKLSDLVRESAKVAPALSPDDVVRALVGSTGLDFRSLYAIFNALDNLNVLKTEYGTSDVAVDKIIAALGNEAIPGIDGKRDQIKAALAIYSDDNPVAVSLKAQRLIYLREKMFVDAEIITDARPVFDSDAGKVLEYVITHSLLVTYHEDEGYDSRAQHKHSRIHIALDFDDLMKLRKACERAVLKSQSLKADLGDKGRILGSNDDG